MPVPDRCGYAAIIALTSGLFVTGCARDSVTIPFDGSGSQVAIEATSRGKRLTLLVDTAVTPSVIDLSTARSLGMSRGEIASGEAGGTGTASAAVFPADLRDFQIGGLKVDEVEAVAFDMHALSRKFGRPLHGILGESFLRGRTVLIDYQRQTITFFVAAADAERAVASCSVRYRQPLEFVSGDVAPKLIISIDTRRVPVSLDTGSALGLELYDGALPEGEGGRVLSRRTARTVTGSRGDAGVSDALLGATVHLGPFRWDRPTVVLSGPKGSPGTRLGNLGNQFLQKKTLLLDYQGMMLGLYERCGKRPAKSSARQPS